MGNLRFFFGVFFAAGAAPLVLGLSGCGGGGNAATYSLTVSAPSPAAVTAGNITKATATLSANNGYIGTVTLSCVATAPASGTSCSISPNPIATSGSASTTVTVATTSSTPGGSYAFNISAQDSNGAASSNGPQPLNITTAAVIQHIVLIVQENRTPDNLFQGLCIPPYGSPNACGTGPGQYDIAQQGVNSTGQTMPLAPIDLGTTGSNPQNYDLGHSHADFVSMFDGGKMDGADLVACMPAAECPPNAHANAAFMYVNPADVAPYLQMAQQYTFADRMFQTNQGPSFPAHQFIYSGTSAPSPPGSPLSNYFAAENIGNVATGGLDSIAGCIAPTGTVAALIGPTGVEQTPGTYPCYEHPVMSDLLNAQGISWRYYTVSAGSIWTAPDAIQHVCQAANINGTLSCTSSDWTNNVVINSGQILQDVTNGQLPQVSWVVPDGRESDHALANDGTGPSWVTAVVNAIGQSQYWANTAIIVTWDDWGGWYDHVPPRIVNDGVSWGSGYVYGFRVPMIVISPYAKAKYVSHVTHDFGSILKYIETTYGLPSLGYADAYADDLSDCFDMTQKPIPYQKFSAPVGADYFRHLKGPPVDPDDD